MPKCANFAPVGTNANEKVGNRWVQMLLSTFLARSKYFQYKRNPLTDYAGTGPFSEPESLYHKQHITSLHNIRAYLSYHSYGEKIIYPYSMSNSAEAKNKAELDFMAQRMSHQIRSAPGGGIKISKN